MCFLDRHVLFFLFSISLGYCVSIRGINNKKHSGDPLLRLHDWEVKLGVRSEGIFERFVRNYLDMLSTAFTGKDLIRYCRMISKELKKMEFTYTERLARHFRYLARMYRDDILEEMAKYRREFDEKLPKRQLFLQAFNDAFTLQHSLQFDDYIHDMLDLANGHILSIKDQTRKLLDMIVNCVDKLGEKDKRALEKKMILGIKEYNYD